MGIVFVAKPAKVAEYDNTLEYSNESDLKIVKDITLWIMGRMEMSEANGVKLIDGGFFWAIGIKHIDHELTIEVQGCHWKDTGLPAWLITPYVRLGILDRFFLKRRELKVESEANLIARLRDCLKIGVNEEVLDGFLESTSKNVSKLIEY